MLPERARKVLSASAQKPVLVVRKDPKKELRRESSGKRLVAGLSPRQNPKLVPPARRKIDYAPMQTSMRTRERQKRPVKPQKARQVKSSDQHDSELTAKSETRNQILRI